MIRKILRKVHRIFLGALMRYKDFMVSRRAIESTILETIRGQQTLGQKKRLCLMAHFDAFGRFHECLQYYIRHLNERGFEIVLCSTAPRLDPHDLAAITPYCSLILRRENIGLDFASWKAALSQLTDLSRYDLLLVNNDSVFGPIFDLEPIFKAFEHSDADMGGLTDCWLKSYHLQSYFLLFKKAAFGSPAFQNFWSRVRLSYDKEAIIERYEVGVTQHFLAHHFKTFAAFPYHELRDRALEEKSFQYHKDVVKQPVNPSIYMWDVLVRDFQFPFIKGEVLKLNKFESKNAYRWRSYIPGEKKYLREMISEYLKLGHRNCVG